MLGFAAHLAWQLRRLDIDDPARCLTLFRSNRDAGLILAAGLLGGRDPVTAVALIRGAASA